MGSNHDGIARKAVATRRLLNASNYRLSALTTTLARLRIIINSVTVITVGVVIGIAICIGICICVGICVSICVGIGVGIAVGVIGT